MRTLDLPPFLGHLLASIVRDGARSCTCRNTEAPWCRGGEFVFLGPHGGHFRRSTYARRNLRPAADGWYPRDERLEAMPVLVDASGPWPGRPLAAWPPAVVGHPFTPPRGRGRIPDSTPLASWLPVLPDLTAHGLRHAHQTWLDEAGIPYVLQAERMGHEVPGMRGVYTHVTDTMRDQLTAILQQLWDNALAKRAELAPRSPVRIVDDLLAAHRRTRIAPRLPNRSL